MLDSTDGPATWLEKKRYLYDDTPLLVAAQAGNTRIVQLLLNCGADVNVQDGQGDSALHLVASRDHVECARVLLGVEGIRLDLANKFRCTPFDTARKLGNNDVKKLLKSAG